MLKVKDKLYLSWSDIEKCVDTLCNRILLSNIPINTVHGLARGGYIDIYCDTYDVAEFLNLETDKNLDISKLQKMELDELVEQNNLEFISLFTLEDVINAQVHYE